MPTSGATAEMSGAVGSGAAAVAALAKRGANLRCCAEGCGLSPLLVACQRGRAEVVSLLLELGVSNDRRFHAV